MELCSDQNTSFFRSFSEVFVYPAILLSGVALFSTWWDCLLLWGLLLGNFAEVFFHLSDGVRFSTCVRLLPVRVFPFFLFLDVVFLILLGTFSWVFLYCAFLLSGSDLSSTPCIGLLCLLRMHTINSCVGDTCQ